MAVESGLADQQAQRAAQFLTGVLHLLPYREQRIAGSVVAAADIDAGRRPVLAEHFPQYLAPLPGGDTRMGALDGGGHDIGATRGCLPQSLQ